MVAKKKPAGDPKPAKSKAAKPAAEKKPKAAKTQASVTEAMLAIEQSQAAGRNGLLDAALSSALTAMNAKIAAEGDEKVHLYVKSAEQALAEFICLPLPSLAPRFLFKSEGLPLTRFVLVTGFEESCKTAFTFEMGRWHRLASGNHFVIECEQKDSTGLCDSIYRYDRGAWKQIRCHSQDQWNQAFFNVIDVCRRVMDGYDETREDAKGRSRKVHVPGTGRVSPMLISVDSLSAVLIERFIDKIMEEGAPDITHPMGARLLSDFFKVGPKMMVAYPITFAAVSHVKMSSDPRTPYIKQRNTAGGAAPKYQMSLDVELKRLSKIEVVRSHPLFGDIHSIPLQMKTFKNSFGGHSAINVEMTWYFDPNDRTPTGECRQKTYFDWPSASIELLLDCCRGSASRAGQEAGGDESRKLDNVFTPARAKKLFNLIELYPANARQCWSPVLGISEKDKLSYYEAGEILERKIQQDVDFRRQLYELLEIPLRYMFQPGVDYQAQIEDHRRIREQETRLLRLPDDSPVPLAFLSGEDVAPLPASPTDVPSEPAEPAAAESSAPVDAQPFKPGPTTNAAWG